MGNRKLIVYLAMSLDGYIAGEKDDLSFLNQVEKEGEDYGYQSFISQIDTVIVGRRTYEKVMSMVDEFPHLEMITYVLTSKEQPAQTNITFYNGDLKTLVQSLKKETGKHIFCDGGGQTIRNLLQLKLIDEMIISVVPVLLGTGISLFGDNQFETQKLKLTECKSFDTGLVQLHYVVSKES